MSIFNVNSSNFEDTNDITISDTFREAVIYDELSHLPEVELEAFLNSEQCEAMCEEGMISRRTLVRLSKNDDLSRRTVVAAMDLAKKNNDPLWDKLVAVNKKKKEYVAAIVKKYNAKASKAARIAQKEYIQGNKSYFSKSGLSQAVKTANQTMKVSNDKAKGNSKWLNYNKKTGFSDDD